MMKQLAVVALLFAFPRLSAQTNVKLTGTIQDPAGSIVKVSYYPFGQYLGEKGYIYTDSIRGGGTFSLSFPLTNPQLLAFEHGNEVSSFFMYPGDSLSLSLDTKMFDETIRYEGTTRSAAASNFMAALYLKFEESPQDRYKLLMESAPVDYKAALQAKYKLKTAYLDEQTPETLPAELGEYLRMNDYYKLMGDVLQFPAYYGYMHSIPEDSVKLPADYYDFLDGLEIQNEKAAAVPEYFTFLRNYTYHRWYHSRTPAERVGYDWKDRIKNASEILSGTPLALMEVYHISIFMDGSDPEAIQAYENMVASGKYPQITSPLQDVYQLAKRLAPGNPAPAFTLVNVEGKEVSLSDLKGKVVYLDFWASWCRPCIGEMPYSHELVRRFEGEEVVFLYLDVDDAEKNWKKAIETHKITGLHLRAPQGHPVQENYGVRGIPSYFIINRDGTIFARGAKRPSDPGVDQQIRDALAIGR